ncbi:Pectinesterase 3 [Apostasia shenzhenica]|uniref:Pectinesterase n=1 Tax=Apostasia shenzhenica TaxID=1088818 RepID=A0A2I0AQ66_9ASPA|nr:Pectinesterase 3 [Apostasia shenzhenica]
MAIPVTKPSKLLFAGGILISFVLVAGGIKPPAETRRHTEATPDPHTAAAAGHCAGTLFPSLCLSTLLSIPELAKTPLPAVIAAAVNHTADSVRSSYHNCSVIFHRPSFLDFRQRIALSDCLDLLDVSLDFLHLAVSDLCLSNPSTRLAELFTILSAAITDQFTCLDGFAFVPEAESIRPQIEHALVHTYRLVSNALAMAKKIPPPPGVGAKGEPFEGYGKMKGGFPAWVSRKDRRLLAAAPGGLKADLVVATDGSGNFTTVGAAVAAAPNNSAARFVIYIKAGAYFENVEVGTNKINLMFVGDGIGNTVIKANRNVVDGWTTFRSATVAVVGNGFIGRDLTIENSAGPSKHQLFALRTGADLSAFYRCSFVGYQEHPSVVGNGFIGRDLTIENSAGPSKHQAVALRTGADLSAFYRCSFVGYQDTLYVHSLRQFYRECDIYGTIDIVFGDSPVVLQSCNFYARKPNPSQKNVFTAQGREDPNQNTGISIQSSKIAAAADLVPVLSQFQTYLGRPWKKYSRTVILQSFLDSLIDPAGWLEWNGSFALDTLFYGEYQNRGPGANTTARVKWPGYRVITSAAEAMKFTVGDFIQGDQWLKGYGIPYTSGLS